MRALPMNFFPIVLILVGGLFYSYGKLTNIDLIGTTQISITQTEPTPALFQALLAGPNKGLVADINILHVFTLYDQISHYATAKQSETLWQHLKTRLQTASKLDPYFWDTYRLAAGLLAYQEGYSNEAVRLMERGSHYRSWDWETPFLAGFLAYDRLDDAKLAAELMKISATRPDAPELAAGLAARFLSKSSSPEEALRFLYYLKSLLPKNMHSAINWRIRRLKKNPKSYMDNTK